MKTSSKELGNRYERKILEYFRRVDLDSFRNVGSGATKVKKADIYCPKLKFFIECKHRKQLSRKELMDIWDDTVIKADKEELCPLLIFKHKGIQYDIVMFFLQGSTVMTFLEDFLKKCHYVGDANVIPENNEKQEDDSCDRPRQEKS